MKCSSLRSNHHGILDHPRIDLSSTSDADHAPIFIRSASLTPLVSDFQQKHTEHQNTLVSILSTAATPSKRLQVFDQVQLLFRSESQTEQSVVMINHCRQIRSASVMEIGRMLPKRAQRCRTVLFSRATLRIQRVSIHLCRIMQERNVGVRSTENIGKGRWDVATCAARFTFEECLTSFRRHLIE